MNPADMSKEQMQKMVLLVLVAVIAVAAALYFGLTPLINKQKSLKAEIAEVNSKIAGAERLRSQQSELRAGFALHHQTLSHIYREYLPMGTGALLWATERVYSAARQTDVEIGGTIAPRRVTVTSWATPRRDRPSERRLAPYGVEITLSAGYEDFRTFVAVLERENPYISISQITISAQPLTPEVHRITVALEWPQHLDGTVYSVEEKAALLSNETTVVPPPARTPNRRNS